MSLASHRWSRNFSIVSVERDGRGSSKGCCERKSIGERARVNTTLRAPMVLFRTQPRAPAPPRPRVTARPNLRPAFSHIRPRTTPRVPRPRLSPRLLRVLARVGRVTTAAGRAAVLAAEGVTAAEAAMVLAAAGVAYGTYRTAKYVKKNAPAWKAQARKDGRVPGSSGRPWMPQEAPSKRPKPTPGQTPTSGNKRPDRPEDYWGDQDERPAKRPGNPVHHHDGWLPIDDDMDDPYDPEDPEAPEYRDIPGPGTDWSGNPGAHNTRALPKRRQH